MMRLVLLLVLLTVAALGLATVADLNGTIAVTVLGSKIETTLVVGVSAVLVLTLVLMSVWSALRFIFRIPDLISLGFSARRRHKGHLAVSRGMIAVGAGDTLLARKSANEAKRLLGHEPLSLLLSAQAAQMENNRAGADRAFRAMLSNPETRLLGLRGLFIEAKRAGDLAVARQCADDALALSLKAAWATEALIEMLVAEKDFDKALVTLDRGRAGFEKKDLNRKRAVLLTALGLQQELGTPEDALHALQDACNRAPDLVPAQAALGRLRARRGDARKASRGLESAWSQMPHPDLADAYLAVRSGDAAREKVKRAERLHALQPGHEESRLVLARAALDSRDFDRARDVMMPLIQDRPRVRACLLMAELEERDQNNLGLAREWLTRAAHAPRDETWVADGVTSDIWLPASPVTGQLDRCRWMVPPDAHDAGRIAHILDTALRSMPTPHAPLAAPRSSLSAKTFLAEQGLVNDTPSSHEDQTPSKPSVNRGSVVFPLPRSPDDPGPGITSDGVVVSDRAKEHDA